MMVPTVHLNGTSQDELERQIEAASSAVFDAIATVADAAPHGRDYHVQGDNAYERACTEHNARMAKLRSVYDDLTELCVAIAGQRGA